MPSKIPAFADAQFQEVAVVKLKFKIMDYKNNGTAFLKKFKMKYHPFSLLQEKKFTVAQNMEARNGKGFSPFARELEV